MRVEFHTCFPLSAGRVHEVFGPGAVAFAAAATAQAGAKALWITEAWRPEAINPVALSDFIDPSRLLMAKTPEQTDSLAVAEEALKDGSVACVAIEISRPLDLREGRRLQLAAKAGKATGLCVIPEGMGSNAAETRWYAAPVFAPQTFDAQREDSTLMHWEITKNKSGTLGAWHVRWTPQMHRLDVVSPVAQRPSSTGASG